MSDRDSAKGARDEKIRNRVEVLESLAGERSFFFVENVEHALGTDKASRDNVIQLVESVEALELESLPPDSEIVLLRWRLRQFIGIGPDGATDAKST